MTMTTFTNSVFLQIDEIVKISMMANAVEDQTMTQIYTAKLMLVLALLRQVLNEVFSKKQHKIYQNLFSNKIFVN